MAWWPVMTNVGGQETDLENGPVGDGNRGWFGTPQKVVAAVTAMVVVVAMVALVIVGTVNGPGDDEQVTADRESSKSSVSKRDTSTTSLSLPPLPTTTATSSTISTIPDTVPLPPPPQPAVTSTVPVTAPQQTTTTGVPCPTGRVVFHSAYAKWASGQPPKPEEFYGEVEAGLSATNETGHDVYVQYPGLEVLVGDNNWTVAIYPESQRAGPGATVTGTGMNVGDGSVTPKVVDFYRDNAVVYWDDPAFGGCPGPELVDG